MSTRPDRQPIVVKHDGGVKFVARIRSHELRVDQPQYAGGEDTAPAPIELLGASLGTCVALYVQQFCHVRGLPYHGMRVEVRSAAATNPGRIGQFDVRVVLPTPLPSQYAQAIERVAQSCPAHHTLTHSVHVGVAIDMGDESNIVSADVAPSVAPVKLE
jgi:ribosomal protein S12 methylthiotransferase accessory factor